MKYGTTPIKGVRHGWFVIPNVQTGDRHFEEQALALQPAFDECAGKSVLDLGCAEGLISHEFARRGARSVHGWDAVKDHVLTARRHFDHPAIKYAVVDLNKSAFLDLGTRYDIVVALGVLHKMHEPAQGMKFALKSCNDLFLLRSGLREHNGVIHSKFTTNSVLIVPTLTAMGFVLEKTVQGWPARSPGEDIQYWRRQR